MSDVTGTSVASGEARELPPPEVPDRCIRCQVDLSGGRQAARFCPRCGARRVEMAGESAINPSATEAPAAFSDQLIATEPTAVAPAPPAPSSVPAIPTAEQAAAWLQLRMAQPPGGRAADAFKPQRANDDDVHSLMLLGYANAMYRLGWRYETGLGSGHNPQEALRCYFKAAKLGNIAALTRLAPQCVANAPMGMNTQPDGGMSTESGVPRPPGTAS